MHPLLVDVLNQVEDAEAEASRLGEAVERSATIDLTDDPLVGWLLLQGVASAVEKIYSGYEQAMNRIAVTVDGAPVVPDGSWHRTLLSRMARPVPGVRPAVLSPSTAAALDALRAFRHRERNVYGSLLDRAKVMENVARVPVVVAGFRADLVALADHLNAPAP